MLSTPVEITEYLIQKEWVTKDNQLQIEHLDGGVSNQVWKITGQQISWVMKQALPKLKVEVDWYADVRRIETERIAMTALNAILEQPSVPGILHYDEKAHIFIMTCAPEGSMNWKEELMLGQFDPNIAAQAGQLLYDIHHKSIGHEGTIRPRLNDLTFFNELRVDPFHRYLVEQNPDLKVPIENLIRQLMDERTCFVHGDYSPKNMLITPDRRILLLDFEVAHWGNPLFDISFILCHLMLKGFVLERSDACISSIEQFISAYKADVSGVLPHLGLMLLARMDGKSPAGYVQDPVLKKRIRQIGIAWVCLKNNSTTVIHEITRAIRGEC